MICNEKNYTFIKNSIKIYKSVYIMIFEAWFIVH